MYYFGKNDLGLILWTYYYGKIVLIMGTSNNGKNLFIVFMYYYGKNVIIVFRASRFESEIRVPGDLDLNLKLK